MPSNKHSSPFGRNLWQTIAALILTIIAFIIYVYSEKQTDKMNDMRLNSFLLADELRQSSDDLTRMVRTYVITGDPLYKEHYQEILDIRNGEKLRPVNYQNIYWDLVELDDKRPRPCSHQTVPLIEMMRQAEFTRDEFNKLSEAKNNSDALTQTEFTAMKLIESNGSESEKLLQKQKAIGLLHDETYHKAKASIMHPIDDFDILMKKRTNDAVYRAEMIALILRLFFIVTGIILFYKLWHLYKTINQILGGTIDTLHTHIMRIGQGDFSIPIIVKPETENSVLGWLRETQSTLKDLITKNERLKQLYAALSQCNQAIVRSKNQEELFPIICRDAVNFGGLTMAWIGLMDSHNQQIIPVASYGEGIEYLDELHVHLHSDNILGQGPTGRAFNENHPVWCQNFQNDPTTSPWHLKGKKYSFGSSAALPLECNGIPVGVFTLYSNQVDAFDNEAQKLLEEMANDISYALDTFRLNQERENAEEQVRYLVNYDSLTGLSNRTRLNEYVLLTLERAKRHNENFCVMFLDVDHFKDINETLGHKIGDQLLIESAQRLKSVLRDEDIIARLGGDEFILLLPSIQMNGADKVAQKLLDAIQKAFLIEDNEISISVSIGISLYPYDGENFETLYKNADIAMYRAKQDGRNGYCFFTEEMQRHSIRNMTLGNALRHALEENEFQIHYQPQIRSKDGKIIGAEALLRWYYPALGFISPAEFIPIAEENGLILPIGEWVLRNAVQQAKKWIDQGYEPIIMAVNLSAVQFRHSALPDTVSNILMEVGLPPEYLELELTEGVAMHDPHKAISIMNDLHERGVRMSIDDFGTGYSSLSYLKKFKIYKLKIDQSFVRDINIDDEDKAIVSAIISMAKRLGLQTIAEGVETIGQLEYLQAEGCDEIQGYYYSKPLPAEVFEAFRTGR